MSVGTVNRREILVAALIVALNPAQAASYAEFGLSRRLSELPASLSDVLFYDQELEKIGREYLRMHPEEADADYLAGVALGTGRNFFRRCHERDCERLDMVKVNGILLSRSEARLYAIAALVKAA